MSAYLPLNEPVLADRRVRFGKIPRGILWCGLGGAGLLATALLVPARPTNDTPTLILLPAAETGQAPTVQGRKQELPALAVRGTRIEREHDFITVLGRTANISPHSLTNVEAVIELFDAAGDLRRVETALLELPSLRPGEESPFRVQTRDAPDITAYRVRFRHLLGATIPSHDKPER